jgi:hypothetical protein
MANTIRRTPTRRARALMATAALLASVAAACRAPTLASATSPRTVPPGGEAKQNDRADTAAGTGEHGAAAAAIEAPPRVVVMPSGEAYLVLRAGLEQVADGIVWDVLYLAGYDPAELAPPDAQGRLAAFAQDLLEAFRPIADLAQVDRFSVTAAFGKPGGSAVVERLWFRRDAATWRADAAAAERGAAQLPKVETDVAREPREEASARDAAAGFISDTDRADYDAAWEKTSARVKAMMSRVEFERHLAAIRAVESDDERKVFVSFSVPVERFLPGANMVAWVARTTDDGPAVETLELRLDDDMEWRVSGVVQLIAPAPSEMRPQAQSSAIETGTAL